jgi:hypothetical protein
LFLQSALTERIIIVSIFQIWPIIYEFFFAYNLLKRAKNRSTATLSCLFIFTALAYFLTSASIFLTNTPFAYLCYIIGFFAFIFAHSFIIIFSWLIVNLDEKISSKYYLGILFYGILSTYVFWVGIFFEGIRYDSGTGWIPVFSWLFLFISYSYTIIFLIVPEIILAVKLINMFEGIPLKRRIKLFLISVFLEFAIVLLIILYNTWINNNLVFKVFYFLITQPVGTLAAYFIYRSFGKGLE